MPTRGKITNKATDLKTRTQIVKILLVVAVILSVSSGWLWVRNVANGSRRVFSDMLSSSLSSRSAAKQVLQDSGAQKLDQRIVFQTGSSANAHAMTALSQGANDSTSVITESIGTPDADYVRYADIKTDQKSADGKPLNFQDAVNVWGKAQGAEGGQLFNEAMLGVVPIGFIPHSQRQELLKFMRDKNVFDVDYKNVKKEMTNGRPRYTYNVQVAPENYINMLKQFGKGVGLKQVDAFDPASFRDSPTLELSIAVDVWSRQLVGLNFAGAGRTENVVSYGQESTVTIPDKTITIDELQNRLRAVQ